MCKCSTPREWVVLAGGVATYHLPGSDFSALMGIEPSCVQPGTTSICTWNSKLYMTGVLAGYWGVRGKGPECQKYGPPGRKACWSSYHRQISSTTQQEFNQYRRETAKMVADCLAQEQVTYRGAYLTAFQEVLREVSPAVQVRQIVQTMYSAYQNTTNGTTACWVCLPFKEKGLMGSRSHTTKTVPVILSSPTKQ